MTATLALPEYNEDGIYVMAPRTVADCDFDLGCATRAFALALRQQDLKVAARKQRRIDWLLDVRLILDGGASGVGVAHNV